MTRAIHTTAGLRPAYGYRPSALPAPLAMPDQDFSHPFHDPAAPAKGPARHHSRLSRALVLSLPWPVAGGFVWATCLALGADETLTFAEGLLAALSGIAIFFMAMSVVSAVCGMFWRAPPRAQAAAPGLRVAILLPMYGEDPSETIGPAVEMLADLRRPGHLHRFSLHVLSDTRNTRAALDEAAIVAWASEAHPELTITYRHRVRNTDYKQGNIREWISRYGSVHDAMLVFDADSRMGRDTVLSMADALVADPGCALVQTIPQTLAGDTIWQRLQCFASRVYGGPHGRGFAMWTGSEGNFLGHNALIRVRAFAASAGLPHLSGPRPLGGVIQSHDFVEAALLRRAGWGVRFMPEAMDSHEEAPSNLIAHLKRDARWCQGNLQHLRLLAVPGLHWVSRIHFLSGAMAYVGSVLLAAMVALWLGIDPPTEAHDIDGLGAWLGAVVAFLLFAPRVLGVADFLRRNGLPKEQRLDFAAMLLLETAIAVLTAPVMMVHHCKIIFGALTGRDTGWPPHQSGRMPWKVLWNFHALETGLGALLLGLALSGWVSLWILPFALGLVLAVPISAVVSSSGRHCLVPGQNS